MTRSNPAATVAVPPPAGRRTFAQRWLLDPLRAQLTRGVSPRRLALTLGVGTACSLFPFLGLTSLLNLGVGWALRLNHPILQTLNQLLGPVQLALILVYVQAGEWLWGAESAERFTVAEMVRTFQEASLAEFLGRFGWAGVHAFTAWLLSAPIVIAILYAASRRPLERMRRFS